MPALRLTLNGSPYEVDGISPTRTALDWLREDARLTGTKEGCAEGDCGACTIAVARNGGRYRAVNACLVMLPQLDGCSVLTVEGLAPAQGDLHPVQRALAEGDGTQCGFCTPGFVMALFALHQDGEPADDGAIHDALAGNLCRCTGYRSIVEAARRALSEPAAPRAAAHLPRADTDYRAGGQIFLAPRDLESLFAAMQEHPDAVILGGGTDIGLRVSKDRERLPAVISTAQVEALKVLTVTAHALEIGGAVSYSDALPQIDDTFPAFAQVIRRIGSRQIRNLGTIAGNLANASPIGDTIPCLIALDASVVLRSRAGSRDLPVEDFIQGYRKTALAADEIIESIRIPLLAAHCRFAAYKVSKRFDQDISAVVAAFVLTLAAGKVKSLRAAYGGMAATARRAARTEQALTGQPWTAASLAGVDRLIDSDFAPLSDQRGSARYRARVAANLLRRLQAETVATAPMARLEAL